MLDGHPRNGNIFAMRNRVPEIWKFALKSDHEDRNGSPKLSQSSNRICETHLLSQFHHAGDEKADREHRQAEAKDVGEVGQPGEEVSAHMGLIGEAPDVAAHAKTYL